MNRYLLIYLLSLSFISFSQNEVRSNQYFLNNELINPSFVLHQPKVNGHDLFSLTGDLNFNGSVNMYSFIDNFNKGMSAKFIREESYREAQINYIKSFTKKLKQNSKSGICNYYFSGGLNFISLDHKILLDQSYGLTISKQIHDDFKFSKDFVIQIASNNVWHKNRLFFFSLTKPIIDILPTNRRASKGLNLSGFQLKAILEGTFYHKIFVDFGLHIEFFQNFLVLQYLYRSSSQNIYSIRIRFLDPILLSFNYIQNNRLKSDSYNFAITLDFSALRCIFAAPRTLQKHGNTTPEN